MCFGYSRIPGATLQRAKLGLNEAIRCSAVFHLFLHPWNLLVKDEFQQLSKFLEYVSNKRDRGEIIVAIMADLAHSGR
jgi:hypothetical protein